MTTENDAGAELLWGNRERPPRGPKPSLSVDRIARTAIEIADAEGLSALSMQRLARDLGSGTMSLYRYIPGKDELISLMLDISIGEPPNAINEADGWRAALELWAREHLAMFQRHPWTLQLATTPRILGPNETAHVEVALRAMSGTGLSSTAMLDTVLLVNSYVRGVAQHSINTGRGKHDVVTPYQSGFSAEVVEKFGRQDRFPTLAAVMTDHAEDDDGERTFEFGLQRILDGIDARVGSER